MFYQLNSTLELNALNERHLFPIWGYPDPCSSESTIHVAASDVYQQAATVEPVPDGTQGVPFIICFSFLSLGHSEIKYSQITLKEIRQQLHLLAPKQIQHCQFS